MLNHLEVWSALAGLAVALIFGVGPHMGFKMPIWFARAGFVTGILLLAASPLIFLFRDEEPGTAATNSISNEGSNNCNVIGSGNQVNCPNGTPQRGHPIDEKLPGFASGLMVQTNDVTEERKKYQYSFQTPERSKVSFYLSASNRYAFTVTDIHGSEYTLDIPLGSNGIPFGAFSYVFCEVGTASSYSYLRALVNGSQVARKDLDFPLELGSRKWAPILGADSDGRNNGAFSLRDMIFSTTTLNDSELKATAKNELDFYKLTRKK